MELNWAWILGICGVLAALALAAWSLSSGSRARIIGAVIGAVVGAGAGYGIMAASDQPGLASAQGFLFAVVLGAIAAGLVIYGLLSRTRRAAALVTAGTMIAAAVAVGQLAVALTRE
jgi:hypothetical protein